MFFLLAIIIDYSINIDHQNFNISSKLVKFKFYTAASGIHEIFSEYILSQYAEVGRFLVESEISISIVHLWV